MKKLLIFIHIIILTCAYAPFLNQWITPNFIPYWTFSALIFPVAVISNIIMVMLWLTYRWKISALFLTISIPLIYLIKTWFPFWNGTSDTKSDISLMTYNVRYFYDDYDGIKNLMLKKNPDVIFIQEMGPKPEKLIEKLSENQKYYFEDYNSLGFASIYPIIETNQIRYNRYPIAAVYSDVALPEDTIRLINVYLESLHLDQSKIKKTGTKNYDIKNKSKMLVTKVSKAAQVHQKQINLIQKLVKQSPYPVILGGDFNAVPASYEYYELKKGLDDSFVTSGNQLGNTFRSLKIPLKLDYIFHSQALEPISYQIIKVNYSDHYPSLAKFKIVK